jgi:hypothetical protein
MKKNHVSVNSVNVSILDWCLHKLPIEGTAVLVIAFPLCLSVYPTEVNLPDLSLECRVGKVHFGSGGVKAADFQNIAENIWVFLLKYIV